MIWENILLALSSLKSNKMRAILTMLGIIIGIMSIITIVIIGDAMTATVSENLSSLGANNVTVSIQERSTTNSFNMRGMGGMRVSSSGKSPSSEDLITDEMIDELKKQFPDTVQGVSLNRGVGQAKAQDGDLYANVSIEGTNADYFLANSITLLEGRLTTDEDSENISYTAVVSDKLVNNMFDPGTEAVGREIKVYTDTEIQIYTIIGVYEYEQNGFFGTESEQDITSTMYIPLSTASQNILEKKHTYLTVITDINKDVEKATDEIQAYFNGIYASNETWSVSVSNMSSMMDTVNDTLGTISSAIALIAGISLIVGGIGVMNIMLVSVTERTREIGTRKALGAKNFHIQFQFVVEALIIALIGGIIGMILGVGLGALITVYMDAVLVVSPFVVVGSMLFSMVIGIFFGLYPANKAAKLDPIDALRYE